MTQELNKDDLKRSILIVIQPNGSHHIRIPEDDHLVFDRRAYHSMINTLTVLNEPSYVLQAVLWIERWAQRLSRCLFSRSAQRSKMGHDE